MSTTTIPQFETRHRLALALEAADVEPEDMAQALGVSKTTVYNYMAGIRTPKLGMIKQWAFRCSVPWQWIVTGELPGDDDGDELSKRNTQRQQPGIFGDIPRPLKLVA